MVQIADIPNHVKANKLLMSVQAPFLNVQKTFDRSRSSLGLHGDDVCSHQFRPRSSSNELSCSSTVYMNQEFKTDSN
ncbi:hypothetical protein Tco_1514802 [Tanacetum coccineum]|uniref:Uncharacterized protein n=1 Tax=Tanacetum coccineum TaxID=301880 RepID=A0ABQ5CXZ2_9ASTR